MNLPSRYWAPDENASIAPDLTHEERLWCVRQLSSDWALYWPTVNEAFAALEQRNPDKMAALVDEIDDDNAASEWLDCGPRPETTADVLLGIARLPALMRRQVG